MSEANKKMFSAERAMKTKLMAKPAANGANGADGNAIAVADMSGITNQDLLTAIKALQSEVIMRVAQASHSEEKKEESSISDKEAGSGVDELNLLRTEVQALSRSIHDTKREIKALGLNEEDKFSIVTSELDEIVAATERATETILSGAEKIDDLAQQLRQHSPDQFVTQLTDEILENTIAMFEACNFQDLCGQRTTKVVNNLKFIEERVEKMLHIWGEENFSSVDHPEDVIVDQADKAPEGEELHGPAEHGGGISQADIDALFD